MEIGWKNCALAVLVLFCAQAMSFAQTSTGTLAGRIVDASTGEALIGSTVLLVGTTQGAAADIDGKFSFKVAPGVYALEARSIGYQSKRVEKISVKAGETEVLTFSLASSDFQVKEVEIVANVAKNNEGNLLNDQRASSGISSGVSAELLARTPDRTMSESFKRISGASIRDGKFAVVRGLQERYNQGMVNGMSQPSTEPDRKAFSLDLFPTALIDRITVSKTGTPDLPGDFAGGVINIATVDIPFSNTFSVMAATEYHSLTTGKTFLQGTTSPTDWLGFDNGKRQLPTGIYNRDEAAADPGYQAEARQSALQNNNFAPTRTSGAAPNMYFQAFLGRRGTLFGKSAGMVLGLNYYRTFTYSDFLNYNVTAEQTDSATGKKSVIGYDSLPQKRYRTVSSASVVANFSFRPDAVTKISLRNLLVQTGADLYQQGYGKELAVAGGPENRRRTFTNYYDQNRLSTHQLSFERALNTDGAKIEALLGASFLDRETPDFKRLIYNYTGDSSHPYSARLATVTREFNPNISGKFFSTLNEQSWNGTTTLTLPFKLGGLKNSFKTGAYYQWRNRNYDGRNFNYTYSIDGGASPLIQNLLTLGPDSIFMPQNMGGKLFYLKETTFPSDFYKASTRLSAAFVMNETNIGPNTKIIYGVRAEVYRQHLIAAEVDGRAINNVTTVTDFFPSINTQIGLKKDLYLRLAYFESVNRPEFRELSPAKFFDATQNIIVYGNSALVRTKIHNVDAKLEFYPRPGAVISINGYYKKIDAPIEMARENVSTFPTFTFQNTRNGIIQGLEFEARSSLAFLYGTSADGTTRTGALTNIVPFVNAALIQSIITDPRDSRFKRPLQGQSPYTLNAGVTYQMPKLGLQSTLTVNRTGTRLAYVGDSYTSCIWERPRTIVDASITYSYKRWNVKGVLGDLLAQKQVFFLLFGPGLSPTDPNARRDFLGTPVYKDGVDIPYFQITYGRTVRLTVTYTL